LVKWKGSFAKALEYPKDFRILFVKEIGMDSVYSLWTIAWAGPPWTMARWQLTGAHPPGRCGSPATTGDSQEAGSGRMYLVGRNLWFVAHGCAMLQQKSYSLHDKIFYCLEYLSLLWPYIFIIAMKNLIIA
jgi:hypothetical protein